MANLNNLTLGESATVLKVAARRPSLRQRLLEMGLLPGTEVTLLRRAPLGDPLELRLRDYTLSLRAEDAASVSVSPIARSAEQPALEPLAAAE